MAEHLTQKFCRHCQRPVLARKPAPSHLLHLVLAILTGGFWVIVWVWATIFQPPWRCSLCGKRV